MITASKNGLLAMAMICTVAVFFSSASAEEVVKEGEPVKADNTKVNKRDREAGEVTADNQKQNKADGNRSVRLIFRRRSADNKRHERREQNRIKMSQLREA